MLELQKKKKLYEYLKMATNKFFTWPRREGQVTCDWQTQRVRITKTGNKKKDSSVDAQIQREDPSTYSPWSAIQTFLFLKKILMVTRVTTVTHLKDQGNTSAIRDRIIVWKRTNMKINQE